MVFDGGFNIHTLTPGEIARVQASIARQKRIELLNKAFFDFWATKNFRPAFTLVDGVFKFRSPTLRDSLKLGPMEKSGELPSDNAPRGGQNADRRQIRRARRKRSGRKS